MTPTVPNPAAKGTAATTADEASARTLVVKWIEDGPGQAPTAHRRLRTELAALQFLGDDIGTGLAPDCCGAPPSGASATPYPCRAGRRNYCRRHGR
ncbi:MULTISPECIES: hypothetical protein [unclassified Streptomyces]|uniref:hypothetical protein n=1 Tax=unclassified Streptomyces TaxID=2593676 RepID=UPI00131A73C7|nr:hypothetical protein [Streptomyces sp. CB01635]